MKQGMKGFEEVTDEEETGLDENNTESEVDPVREERVKAKTKTIEQKAFEQGFASGKLDGYIEALRQVIKDLSSKGEGK